MTYAYALLCGRKDIYSEILYIYIHIVSQSYGQLSLRLLRSEKYSNVVCQIQFIS